MHIELSYTYLSKIVSKMVQTDPRFSVINKPIAEVVSFFQTLFLLLLEKWIGMYPTDFLTDSSHTFTHTQTEHLKAIVVEIEKEYETTTLHFPFILSFFKDTLRLCKTNLSSPFYETLLLRSLEDERPKRLTYYPHSDKIAVIVDPRYDDMMEAVIRNFMHFLNKCGWNLMIFSDVSHKERIARDFPTCLFSSIEEKWITRNPSANMSLDAYNSIFLSKSFWGSIPATHIAIFQKDCIMYHMFDESLFLSYDFAGANYFHPFAIASFSGGINGGFSLRNKKAMIECIENVSWDTIVDYNKKIRPLMHYKEEYHLETRNEDCFFTNACEILRKNMPDILLRDRLAIEVGEPTQLAPAVYHGWNKNYHDIDTAKSILEKSPFFFKYIHNVSD